MAPLLFHRGPAPQEGLTMLKFTPSLVKHFPRMSWLAVLLLFATGPLYAQGAPPMDLPPGTGADLVAAACTQCHSLKPLMLRRDSLPAWRRVVQFMVVMGAQLLPEEADTVTQYLAKNFGPGSRQLKTGRFADQATGAGGKQAESLPEGDGKKLVESRCTVCHDLGIVTALRRTKTDWESIVKNMVEQGAAVKPEEGQVITSYLSAQFGEKTE